MCLQSLNSVEKLALPRSNLQGVLAFIAQFVAGTTQLGARSPSFHRL